MIVAELLAKFGFAVDKGSEKKAQDSINGLKEFAVTAGAAIATSLIATGFRDFVIEMAGLIDETAKTARSLFITTQQFQKLGHAANLAGISSGQFRSGLGRLTKTAGDAARGNATASKAFADLGVKIRDADGKLKTSDQLLLDVADGMSKVKDSTMAASIAGDLFGRGIGGRFVQFMKAGRGAIQSSADELDGLGTVMSDDLVNAGEAAQDNIARFSATLLGLKNDIATMVLPIFNTMSNVLFGDPKQKGDKGLIQQIRAFDKETGIIKMSLRGLLGVFVLLGAAGVVFLTIKLGGLLAVIPSLIASLTAMGTAGLIANLKAFGVGLILIAKWLLIIGAVILALAALQDAWLFLTDPAADTMIRRTLESLKEWAKGPPGADDPWYNEWFRGFINGTDAWVTKLEESGSILDGFWAQTKKANKADLDRWKSWGVGVKGAVSDVYNFVVKWMGELYAGVKDMSTKAISYITKSLSNLFDGLIRKLSENKLSGLILRSWETMKAATGATDNAKTPPQLASISGIAGAAQQTVGATYGAVSTSSITDNSRRTNNITINPPMGTNAHDIATEINMTIGDEQVATMRAQYEASR